MLACFGIVPSHVNFVEAYMSQITATWAQIHSSSFIKERDIISAPLRAHAFRNAVSSTIILSAFSTTFCRARKHLSDAARMTLTNCLS